VTIAELLRAATAEAERRHEDQGHDKAYRMTFAHCQFVACVTRRHLIGWMEKHYAANSQKGPEQR